MGKRKSGYRKLPQKTFRLLIGSVIGVVLLGALLFWGLFYITDVEVVGNTRYTEKEVEDMALDSFFSHNSILLSRFQKHIYLGDIPFMESVDVEYLNRNKIRLHVNEKKIIGYVRQDEVDYYFDKDGMVLESFSASERQGTEDPSVIGNGLIVTNEGNGNGENDDGNMTDSTTFRPALTNVSLITGLKYESVAVGQRLTVETPAVFNTILALTRMIDKYEIQPDQVEFSDDQSMILHYGSVKILLGTDSNLEEKMTRVAAILPKLSGMSGVLHLEDFTDDTQNIIFDPNS
ncbi:MAG: hypothetical protein HFE78_08825 [Clostridiales bacterium]|nr:hypothetical protein [Clostridiales bacterium]